MGIDLEVLKDDQVYLLLQHLKISSSALCLFQKSISQTFLHLLMSPQKSAFKILNVIPGKSLSDKAETPHNRIKKSSIQMIIT